MYEGFGPQLTMLSWPILYFIIMQLSTNFIFIVLPSTSFLFYIIFSSYLFPMSSNTSSHFSHATVVIPSEFSAISSLIICHFLDISLLSSLTKPRVSSPFTNAHHFNWVSFLFFLLAQLLFLSFPLSSNTEKYQDVCHCYA